MQRATIGQLRKAGDISPFSPPAYVTLEFMLGLDGASTIIHGREDEHARAHGYIEEALAYQVYALDEYVPSSILEGEWPIPSIVTVRGRLGWASDIFRESAAGGGGAVQALRGCPHLALYATSIELRPFAELIDNHRWAGHIAWLDRMRRELA